MSNIDFFFDFMSPFAYLAHQRLPQLSDQFGYTLTYKPIDLPRAKLAAGNTGPANRHIPPKIRYLIRDLDRWARAYGVPFHVPDFPAEAAERANKGTFLAISRGRAREYVTRVWHAWFGLATSPSVEDLLGDVARDMGWSPEDLLDFTASREAQRQYELTNAEAHDRGVFGVPMMVIGDEMWWGNDRLEFLREHLEADAARVSSGT